MNFKLLVYYENVIIYCVFIFLKAKFMKKQLIKFLGVCALLLFAVVAHAQTRSVTGMVTDSKSQPVTGAVIKEKGTSNGAISGTDGRFSIKTTTAAPVLQVSFIGMADQEVTVGASNSVTVKMEAGEDALNEVIVSAQNIKRSTRSIGYAMSSVTTKDITEGGDRSVLNGMQGKMAGVDINSAGSNPGASTRIVIRGIQSISQDNQPLIIIDGVPMTNSSTNNTSLNGGFDFGNGLNAVNPEDIESVQVLKGSSASALYGSRAANGVILITTKKGSTNANGKKAIGIDLGFDATYSSVLKLPTFQNSYGQGWSATHALDENGSWGPTFDGKSRVIGREVDNSQLLAPYSALENNVRDFFERGTNYKTHVGINGGSEKSSFYASYSNVKQDGIIPTDEDRYDRNTLAFRGSQNFGKVSMSASANMSNTNSQFVLSGQQENNIYRNILDIPRNMSVIDMQNYRDKFYSINDYFTPYGTTNPYWALYENGNEYDATKFFGSVETKVDLATNLKGVYRFGYDIENNDISTYEAILQPTGPNSTVNNLGSVTEQTIARKQYNHDFNLLWNKEINPLLSVDVVAGANLNERGSSSLSSSVAALDIEGFYNLSNSPATPTVERNDQLRRLFGVYGVASAAYKNMLFLNLSARNDWSSTLPAENNAIFYPAANLSFVFTDAISSKPSWLDFGKLRVGLGNTGNDAPIYVVNSIYTQTGISLPFQDMTFPLAGGTNAFTAGNLIKNPDLRPEITTEIEIGTDLKLLDARMNVELTYYNRVTKGQILQVPVSPGSGSGYYWANAATVENKGVEALISYRVIKNENGFNWTPSVNFTRNRNQVTDLDDAVDRVSLGGLSTIGYYAMLGQPIGVYEGSTYQYSPDGAIVVNTQGLPITGAEKVTYGNSQRNYIMGIKNNFSYKQFSLGVLFDIRKGGLMYTHTASLLSWTGQSATTTFNDRKPFVVPNSVVEVENADGSKSYVENTTPVDPADLHEYHTSDARDAQYVIDKSFTKLRELALTYSLPKSSLEKMPFAGVSISLIGRNLFIWTPSENQFIDPEVTTFGNGNQAEYGEFAANPTTRSYGFSLKFNF